ncbi:MAG: hypothetical protein PHR63_06790 [Methanoregulaceae archaeon]|nr:hypothetical protein [Methanoregulaceae archaeon]
MTGLSTPVIDREFIAGFFHDRGIDLYAVVSASSLHAPAGRRPCDLLASAETMILFCLEMDKDLFSGTPTEISSKVRDFVRKIRGVEDDLVSALKSGGFEAMPVRSVILSGGTIKGALSLPHCAADAGLGEIGDNRLLISYRHGCRIGLGAVVTSIGMEETPRPEPSGETCNHCKKCIRACPEHALSPGTLDLFRCRNVTGSVPGFLLPVMVPFMQSGIRIPFSNWLLDLLAKRKVNACADCLTSCPHFHQDPSDQGS